ncbi:uncharacterized protein FIBRA_01822 [Fibroporia radiculosa]|uniref:Ankyrin repeat domain-containing protein n=1 Tax=Fibroporia radiculosa TaxID=599839 RepID=J4G172_9APHY|nr:uncharacterized protein FIBRA_01822 [Fibroporia radiculosa]CCL99798.1 predicted protein [Fibroporia radiculosa]
MASRMHQMDPALREELRKLAAKQEGGPGRPLQELLQSDEPLKGAESQRLRSYFTSNRMEPSRDLDDLDRVIFKGNLDLVKDTFTALAPSHIPRLPPRKRRAQQLQKAYIKCDGVPRHFGIARWLIAEAKVPVDGTDLSGSQAIYHAISTKPAFDPEYAQILYDAGADACHRNRYGGTAAHEIALTWEFKNKEVLQRAGNALA